MWSCALGTGGGAHTHTHSLSRIGDPRSDFAAHWSITLLGWVPLIGVGLGRQAHFADDSPHKIYTHGSWGQGNGAALRSFCGASEG